MGRGHHVQKKPPGTYKRMAHALPPLEANIAGIDLNNDDLDIRIELPEDEESWSADLPPDFTLLGSMGIEPRSLDEGLCGPNAKEWQAALDYEIGVTGSLGGSEVLA